MCLLPHALHIRLLLTSPVQSTNGQLFDKSSQGKIMRSECHCCFVEDGMNVDFFWNAVRLNAKEWKRTLIFERNIYLDCEYGSVVVVVLGINPFERFTACARIEVRSTGNFIHLDGDSMDNLLKCIDEKFGENAVWPDQAHGNVAIQLVGERLYNIKIVGNKHTIRMSESALLAIRQKQLLIKINMKLIECDKYETQLFNMLNHFCFEATERSVLDVLHSPATRMLNSNVFGELCKLNCTCLDMTFALEIISHCSEWFASCVSIFMKALFELHNRDCVKLPGNENSGQESLSN